MKDLRQAIQDAIHEYGFEILQEPKRLVGVVLDSVELETAVSAAIDSACDEGFFSNFACLLQEDAASQVDGAVASAADYLSEKHAIDPGVAKEIAKGVAEGIVASVEEATATNDEPTIVVVPADKEEPVSETEEDSDRKESASTIDEMVEAAVRHVAEEAEADEETVADDSVSGDDAPTTKKRERRSKQARAAKANGAEDVEATSNAASKPGFLGALSVPAWIAIATACLVLGLVLGRFVLGGTHVSGTSLAGKTSVTERELDDALATYTYNGKNYTVTVREVLEQVGSVEGALDAEGNYKIPSADYALAAARNAILQEEIDARNIEVSDEDLAAYAEKALGTSDYEAIGKNYGIEASEVKDLLMDSCRMNALREEVVGGDLPEMPVAPETPEEGKEQEATKKYAKYIIDLVGDEWDADAGTWANTDGSYATALEGYEVTADAASYDAATAAYYVAYQLYSEQQTAMNNAWTEYLNGLFSNANIQIGSLVS